MNTTRSQHADRSLGLNTLQDISALILNSHDLSETISNIVNLVAQRAQCDVCSLYLLEDDQETLLLRATYGLDPEAIGRVSLKIGEGLTGMVAAEQQVLALVEPHEHPHFRYFAETGEERFHTYVGIPLYDRNLTIGVLVVQTRDVHEFTAEELATLTTIAFQVASIVVDARLLDRIDRATPTSAFSDLPADTAATEHDPLLLQGTPAYPGVVSGSPNIIDSQFGFADVFDECNIDPDAELQRLDEALRKTRVQTLYLEKKVADRLTPEDAAIFHTHLMILEDRGFIERLRDLIEDHHSAPYALKKVIGGYLKAFEGMEDAYLRERAADMEDIGRRLLANLVGKNPSGLHLHQRGILVAKRLLPSDMAVLEHDKILGMIIESHEANSHSVIMARALGIPALIGVKGAVTRIEPDTALILDANSGSVYLNPSPAIREEYRRLEEDRQQELEQLSALRNRPARTQDGTRITLRANIGLVSDVVIANSHGAEGVGLYRTEFPYMARSTFPDRDEQYQLYRKVVEDFAGQTVTIRTLDIGGDKALPYFDVPPEDNPFMGWRSVRVSLDHRDIFQTQIEAILMAAKHGPVRLLFPMISNLEEIRQCRQVIEAAVHHLKEEGLSFNSAVPIGAMIEVPAAIHLAPYLAREVDFFALGTNDLIQYLLAADRSNPRVQNYYEPLHPAVLMSLKHLSDTARAHQVDLCVCGEMAADPAGLLALMGLKIREFSLSAPCIPRLKRFISRVDLARAEELAEAILKESDGRKIRALLEDAIDRFPPPQLTV